MLRYQNLLIGHGVLVTLVALLAGFMLGIGLLDGWELTPSNFVDVPFYYGDAAGWARAHTGGITNGLLLIVMAFVLPHAMGDKVPPPRLFAYGFIFIGWANTIFYWAGNAAGSRALSLGDNVLGASTWFAQIGFVLAGVGAVVAIVLLGWTAWRVLVERD